MKTIKFFSIIALLIGFSFALVQCAKEDNSLNLEQNGSIVSRSTLENPCEPKIPGGVSSFDIVTDITLPGWPTCKLTGYLAFIQSGNTFAFTDFVMEYPNNPDCLDLIEHLENLPFPYNISEYYKIVNAAYAEAKRKFLNDYAIKKHLNSMNEVLTYKYACAQLCKYLDLNCLGLELEQEELKDDPKRTTLNLREDDGCWRYKLVKCGEGCCQTNENYSMVNGQLRLVRASTIAFGDCTNGPTSGKWPKFNWSCANGELIGDCRARCSE